MTIGTVDEFLSVAIDAIKVLKIDQSALQVSQ